MFESLCMDLSRRQLLTTFLGAPFALAACRDQSARPFPEGAIVGQAVDTGHMIRQGLTTFDVSDGAWEETGVAIVGAGIAGLSAAWKLRRTGFNDFVILELEKEAGGTSSSSRGDPVGYPWAAHYLPVPFRENKDLISLIDEMSLVEGRTPDGDVMVREEYLCREPEERVFYKGRWYEGLYLNVDASDDDMRQHAAFQQAVDRWVGWRDARGRRAFAVPMEMGSDDAEVTSLDRISFADWLRQQGFTSERLLWYCDYACRDDYGLKLDQTSAWAGLFYFCSRVRRTGAESQPFITFPEGNGRFVAHLSQGLDARLKRDHAVVSIAPADDTVEIVCMAGGSLRGYRCKRVIFAAPMYTAPFVIRGFRSDAPFVAADFHHNAWFVANLHLKDRPKARFARDFPMAWDNVLYESPSLGYVTATHQKGIDYGPTILTYYYPMCEDPNGRTTLFNYEWRQLAEVCLADLGRAHPDIYDLTQRLDVMRWGHAMISPRPGFVWGGERQKAARPYRNIHFAHTDLGGIALFEEAFYHGLRAADEVLTVVRQTG